MPNRTEASLSNLRQSTPELEIQGPTAHELPATWLYGETITLTATGGHGRYQWITTAPEVVTIKNQHDDSCEVAIEGTGAAPILAFSAGDAAIYKGLKGNKPLLKIVDDTPRHYLEAEQYCQQAGGSLPTQKTIDDILVARKAAEVTAWVRKTFEAVNPRLFWLKDERDEAHVDPTSRPAIWLPPGVYTTMDDHFILSTTICEFNPSNLNQAVASWEQDKDKATPGDQFTTDPWPSPLSGDSSQLPHC